MRRFGAALILLAAVPLLALAALPGASVSPPQSASGLDPELGVPLGEPLQSKAVQLPPPLDGIVGPAWEDAPPLWLDLHYGLHGQESAGGLEMRSLHDDANVYFLVRWPSATPDGEPDVGRNLLTVHWRLAEAGLGVAATPGGQGLACTVGCHTVTANGQGRLLGLRNETIPPGLGGDLPAAGGWAEGVWTLEWSRPRASDNPYDQDMLDAALGYRFFVKLFLGQEGKADPVSDVHELRLGR